MKTILITIALIGFTVVGGYAHTRSCTCKRAHHKTAHQKFVVGLKSTRPPLYTNRIHNLNPYPGNDVWRADEIAPANGNSAIVVYIPLDKNSMEYNTESSYTGNYPKPTLQDTKVDPRENSDQRPNVNALCLYDCMAK